MADVMDKLRYADQAIDRGDYAEVKLAAWEGHLEIARLRAELTAREAECKRLTKALEEKIMGKVMEEIAAERRRQIEQEGWMAEHDDRHGNEEMARAAACYAMSPAFRNILVYKANTIWSALS